MRTVRRLMAVVTGLVMIAALAVFAVSLNSRLTVLDRDTWKETATQVYDFERLHRVFQEFGGELSADMRGEELEALHELRVAFAQETTGVAQVLQPSVEAYVANAVDGIWAYLTGESEVIDLGPLSYEEVLDSSIAELDERVTAVREGRAEAESESVALLAELSADEFSRTVEGIGELYRGAFVFLEPLGYAASDQVHEPTAEDEAFRRTFREFASTLNAVMTISGIVILLCIVMLLLLGTGLRSRLRLIGNTLLWYSIPSVLMLGVAGALARFSAGELPRMAAGETVDPQAAEQAAAFVSAIVREYGSIWMRFFTPLVVFVGVAFALGLLLRISAGRKTADTAR